MTESQVVFPLLFEVVSAFATVGFSLELTPRISEYGKLLLCILMLLGRVGPLTVAFALSKKRSEGNYAFPEEKILLG